MNPSRDFKQELKRKARKEKLRRWTVLILAAAAVVLYAAAWFQPMWGWYLNAPQYPHGLALSIYLDHVQGDISEINILNHYIGMRALEAEDFTEFKWIPLAMVIFIFVALRSAVFGVMGKLVDAFFLFIYFGAYSLWAFGYRLYSYGHNLDSDAAVQIEPFTPPLFGNNEVGQFKVWSDRDSGAYFLFAFPVLLLLAVWLSRKELTTWKEPERDRTLT